MKLNGKPASKHAEVRHKDTLEVRFITEKLTVDAEDVPVEMVFENDDFAIINKDAGMNVHPVPGEGGKSGTLVNALLHRFGSLSVIGGVERPGIVHRLDKDTSGLLIVAKCDTAMRLLQRKMNDRTVKKTYLALVSGIVEEEAGTVESFIGRDPNDRKKMTAKNPVNPKLAKTAFRKLGLLEGKYTLLEVDLLTGRTHQIRVHLSQIGFPIIGDKIYGNEKANAEVLKKHGLTRQWLHAYKLAFEYQKTKYTFTGELKEDLKGFGAERFL